MAETNAAPLGLMGFGLTTVLLNLHNVGLIPLTSMILGMGIFYGGLAQLIAGVIESRKGNTFGTVAFCSYGLFWLSFVALLILPKMGLADAANSHSIGAYLIMWGIFTLIMSVGSLKMRKSVQVIFFSLAILFFLLASAEFAGSEILKRIAGIEGIFCGLSAIYTAVGEILNEVYGREVLPV
ncbi:MAG: acetate uptake transporter [Candidatus Hadarchaeales archaeon]